MWVAYGSIHVAYFEILKPIAGLISMYSRSQKAGTCPSSNRPPKKEGTQHRSSSIHVPTCWSPNITFESPNSRYKYSIWDLVPSYLHPCPKLVGLRCKLLHFRTACKQLACQLLARRPGGAAAAGASPGLELLQNGSIWDGSTSWGSFTRGLGLL